MALDILMEQCSKWLLGSMDVFRVQVSAWQAQVTLISQHGSIYVQISPSLAFVRQCGECWLDVIDFEAIGYQATFSFRVYAILLLVGYLYVNFSGQNRP